SGTGLKGLRQRVELVGGTFEYGPRPDGGFHIESVLPIYVPTTVTWIRKDSARPARDRVSND
ncbi:hypothetical protein ABZ626_38685, partial [Streptomyces longispororuber]